MTARTRRRLAQAGSFVLAGLLLYLALRGVDFAVVAEALRTAHYRWLIPLVLVALVSHLLRAWRWLLLLEATPSDGGPRAQPATLKGAFYSVMIGYMVNYAAPRLGEAARTANLSARTRRSFSSVFGTVVVERLLDTAVLGLALLSAIALLFEQFAVLNERFVGPALERVQAVPVSLAVAALVLMLGVAVLLYRWLRRRALWQERIRPALRSFRGGLLSLGRTGRPVALVASTLGIWVCYGVMAYLPFLILQMAGPYDLSLLDGWCIMALGALGVVVPSPGGIGSYHFITIESLVWLFGVPEAPAATYAVLTHAAQLVLYVAVGFACLLAQGRTLGALWRDLRAKDGGAADGGAEGDEGNTQGEAQGEAQETASASS